MDVPAPQPFPQLPSLPLPYPPILPSDHSMGFLIFMGMFVILLIILLVLACACITRTFTIGYNDHETAADTHPPPPHHPYHPPHPSPHHHQPRSPHIGRACDLMQILKEMVMEASDGFVYKKSKSINGDEGGEKSSSTTECAICLEDFKDGDACKALRECHHVFHKECVVSWLMENNTCPICRAVTSICVTRLPV